MDRYEEWGNVQLQENQVICRCFLGLALANDIVANWGDFCDAMLGVVETGPRAPAEDFRCGIPGGRYFGIAGTAVGLTCTRRSS